MAVIRPHREMCSTPTEDLPMHQLHRALPLGMAAALTALGPGAGQALAAVSKPRPATRTQSLAAPGGAGSRLPHAVRLHVDRPSAVVPVRARAENLGAVE